ncbi:hypothetical protein GCK72_019860 [Caenorhabditis remanei]|uniref:Uncharacterized protein n=1 Tax=Caenorhabditis remanei TaxID=31234 RepID=A0A6A5GEY8_CAERE|nr:hypothetical protein GCK72_019860 [Caenorhabditis remanei]KAF1753304.1 hypothetical protein GCK72_019860 [Caenorhabditis remanei]
MTTEIISFGFSCELNDETVKIYTIEHGIVELKNTGDLELGVWYDLSEKSLEQRNKYENKQCDVWEEDGEVFARVLAIGPNSFFLDKDISQKYKYAVWNPFLKFLDDGDNLFKDKIRGDDVVEIIVKYAPWKNGNFKIVELIEEAPFEGSSYCRLTPWTLEQMARNMTEALLPKPNSICIDQFRRIQPFDVQVGVCIKAEAVNVAFPKTVKPSLGVKPMCSYLFTPTLGLVRWCIREMKTTEPTSSKAAVYNVNSDMFEVGKRLGKWFSFKLVEAKKYRSDEPIRARALIRTTAGNVNEVQVVPKETRVVNGEVEIEASFLFDPKMFESEENSLIEDWNLRHEGLRTDTHFWDTNLGRVEVYPTESETIIRAIESHRQSLGPREAEKLEKEAIVVSVTSVVHVNFIRNFEKYPNHGIFVARRVNTICYLNGGNIIYQ